MCVQPVLSAALLLLSDQSLMEIPRQCRRTIYQTQSHQPPPTMMKKMFLPQSLSAAPSLANSRRFPLLRVISQAVLKWPPAIFPNPSYMLFGAVSSKPPSPLSRAARMPLCSNGEYRFSLGSWKVVFNGTSPEGPDPPYFSPLVRSCNSF